MIILAAYAAHDDGPTLAQRIESAEDRCDHAAFYAADDDPRRPLTTCPTCDAVLRTTPTDEQGWADHWGEQLAEQRDHDASLLRAREEDARW